MTDPNPEPPGRLRPAAAAAALGGLGWLIVDLASIVLDPSRGGAVFIAVEAGWIAVHLLLLIALLGLGRSAAVAGVLGRVGVGIAVLGRLVFLGAEFQSLVQGNDETPLLPLAALLTAVGMVLAGIAVVRSRRWTGWARWAPLATGIYPFVLMFPFVAIGPEPNPYTMAGWGLMWILLGLALRRAAAGPMPAWTRLGPWGGAVRE